MPTPLAADPGKSVANDFGGGRALEAIRVALGSTLTLLPLDLSTLAHCARHQAQLATRHSTQLATVRLQWGTVTSGMCLLLPCCPWMENKSKSLPVVGRLIALLVARAAVTGQ